jgi:glyoxylate carboligase
MRAIDAAVCVLEREGVTTAFGVPGAAINPLYSAMKARGSIAHVLARHVEGASHMAEGYTRALAGNIGVCIGTSGPAGADMITGLYSASAGRSDPVHHRPGAKSAAVQRGLQATHRVDREAGNKVGGDRARGARARVQQAFTLCVQPSRPRADRPPRRAG